MSLVPFDDELLIEPVGFNNLGNTCYFNSIIQCLLSCTSLFRKIAELAKQEKYRFDKDHKFIYKLFKLYMLQNTANKMASLVDLYKELLSISNERIDNVKLSAGGQQDAHETLMIIFDQFDKIPEIKALFGNRYSTIIKCSKCGSHSEPVLVNDMLMKITNPSIKYPSLNKYLYQNIDILEAGYTCANCKDKSAKIRRHKLLTLGTIISVVFNKYDGNKKNIEFPKRLIFKNSSQENINYKLIAQCEHVGSNRGGHYYAICNRKNGVKQLNDSNVSPSSFGNNKESYIVFYHFINKEQAENLQ